MVLLKNFGALKQVCNPTKESLICLVTIQQLPYLINLLIDEVKCAFDTTNLLNLHSFDIIHLANILTDVTNEYGNESSELIYSLYGEKKMISMTVKERDKTPHQVWKGQIYQRMC